MKSIITKEIGTAPIQMTEVEFDKYLKKRKWLADYHYCTKVIEFKVDDKVVAKVEYDAIRKVNKIYITGRK
jgi:hypothetical protein